ncbi:LANO_0F16204g1_1 [Lachancea nothofagi CBS 11611]|uniref:Maintenance of telomere capping protein 6 n=1 Tax=Lachancea nothofagi CBS 11611 TaxID=1266666 RepID=A0A1G4KD08_9SACH|nr:LANO_0F16204g1_1 [Lachancea nothofagi CBS 11611]
MSLVLYELLLTLVVKVVFCQQFWPSLSAGPQLALRSQRDAGTNISIDQVSLTGVYLNNAAIAGDNNNGSEALDIFSHLLGVGVQSYVIELNSSDNMNLSLSNSNTSFGSVLTSLKQYVADSNNVLNANMLVLLLRLAPADTKSNSTTPTNNITAELESNLGLSTLYTPLQLASDRAAGLTQNYKGKDSSQGWPTMDYFLYRLQKRVLVAYIDSNTSARLPSEYVFDSHILNYETNNATNSCPLYQESGLTTTANESWRFLESQFLPSDIHEYIMCGYSPIVSNEYTKDSISSISGLLQNSLLWSWAYNEPNTYEPVKSNSTSLVARRCTVVNYMESNSTSSWVVANCYDKKRSVCRHKDNVFDWVISKLSDDYFSTHEDSDNDVCPTNYTLSFPQTPLQEMALNNYLRNSASSDLEAWIDLNSVSVPDCWVPGGPYASCPYQKDVSARSFVGIITPVSVFSTATIVLLIILTWRKVPIQDNRKRWKKVIHLHSTTETDGVPS